MENLLFSGWASFKKFYEKELIEEFIYDDFSYESSEEINVIAWSMGTLKALEYIKNHKINIKRVSDQPRNQLNIANEKEIKYINLFKERIANGEKLKPEVVTQQLYVPIITNPMCLQCHGKIEESNPKLATKISPT